MPPSSLVRPRTLPAFTAVAASLALLAGCGVSKSKLSGDGGGMEDDGAASRLPPAQRGERLAVAIVGPTLTDEITTTATAISLEGLAFGAPTEVRWQSPAGKGVASGVETWAAADIPLINGENFITIDAVASDGSHASKSILVRRNNFLGVQGQAQLTPPAGFVGDPTDVVVSVAIDTSAGGVNSASLKLVQVDPQGGVAGMIADLSDDGDFAHNGDEIPGDGVYSARFGITKSTASALSLAVTGSDMTGAAAEIAALGSVPFVTHATMQDFDNAAAAASSMDHAYEQAMQSSQLSMAYGAAVAAASADPNVAAAGISSGGTGTWAMTTAGIIAGMMYASDDERGGVEVGNHAAFTGAAANRDFTPSDEGADGADALHARSCPSYDTDSTFRDDEVTIDRLRQLTRYGLVFLTMHGTSYDDLPGTPAAAQLPAHEFLLTSEKITAESLKKYELELKTGQMGLGPLVAGVRRFFITPRFIDQLPGRFPNSLIYVGACRSFWNGEFAAAFIRKGAAAYVGYSDMVKSAFAYQTGTAFLRCLLDGSGKSTEECFATGQHDSGSGADPRGAQWPSTAAWGASKPPVPVAVVHRPAYFKMLARQHVSINAVSGLRNGTFEEIDRTNATHPQSVAWLNKGDARVMSGLGGYKPTEGTKMGLISTGLGFSQSNGELFQTFCVPPGVKQLSYDWNFISAEFKSYCNDPKYQDNLKVTLEEAGAAAGTGTVLQAVKVDDLCATVTESLFRVPDVGYVDKDMMSWATGWKPFKLDVSRWAGSGSSVTLRFSLNDLGDSLYDTVVLIDNITLQ